MYKRSLSAYIDGMLFDTCKPHLVDEKLLIKLIPRIIFLDIFLTFKIFMN